jgi:hypothetical protein
MTAVANYENYEFLLTIYKKDPQMKEYIDYVITNHSKNLNEINPNNSIFTSDSYKYSQDNMTRDIDFVNGKK